MRVVGDPAEPLLVGSEATFLTGVDVGAFVHVVEAASRFMALLLLLTGGASHPFDSALLIPSYHARAISE